MGRICYQVAMSLDGYIAGPDGGHDWIPEDPEIDFGALFARFGTLLMGRRTFEKMRDQVDSDTDPFAPFADKRLLVFSRSLTDIEDPRITLVGDDWRPTVEALRREDAKDIWLFGGGRLFASLLDAGLVDTVELAVVPVLLGGGTPMAPSPFDRRALEPTGQKTYATSGIRLLEYVVR